MMDIYQATGLLTIVTLSLAMRYVLLAPASKNTVVPGAYTPQKNKKKRRPKNVKNSVLECDKQTQEKDADLENDSLEIVKNQNHETINHREEIHHQGNDVQNLNDEWEIIQQKDLNGEFHHHHNVLTEQSQDIGESMENQPNSKVGEKMISLESGSAPANTLISTRKTVITGKYLEDESGWEVQRARVMKIVPAESKSTVKPTKPKKVEVAELTKKQRENARKTQRLKDAKVAEDQLAADRLSIHQKAKVTTRMEGVKAPSVNFTSKRGSITGSIWDSLA